MNRIFEFIPSPEEAVVSRTLMLVHQAMDQHLPSASKANRQFTKTVFSDEGEKTAGLFASPDDEAAYRAQASAFGSYEETSPDGRVAPMDEVDSNGVAHTAKAPAAMAPPPVAKEAAKPSSSASGRKAAEAKAKEKDRERDRDRDRDKEGVFAPLKTEGTEASSHDHAPDWVTRITLVLLLVGLVLLAYVIAA